MPCCSCGRCWWRSDSGFFLIGTVVGSFLNVCIYRIPWQKSVIWPGSRCPHCLVGDRRAGQHPDRELARAAGRVPPLRLRRSRPAIRWSKPWSAFLFLGAYLVDVVGVSSPQGPWGQIPTFQLVVAAYHAVFLALLVAATFIDYDLLMIPDEITVTGMVVGLGLGTHLARDPARAGVGRRPLISGGFLGRACWAWPSAAGLTQVVRRRVGFVASGREAMGLGDVTLLGMIGAFLGWQAAVLTFFLAPFFGLAHAAGNC